jgi:hypothetical protein
MVERDVGYLLYLLATAPSRRLVVVNKVPRGPFRISDCRSRICIATTSFGGQAVLLTCGPHDFGLHISDGDGARDRWVDLNPKR